jgi:hypothetical protein
MHLTQSLAGSDDPKAAAEVELDARHVLGEDAGLNRPDPSASLWEIKVSINRRPIPCPLARSATYTLCSPTPAYAQRSDTGESAIHPTTSPFCVATNRCSAGCVALQRSKVGVSVSNVALPVAMPSAWIASTAGQSSSTNERMPISVCITTSDSIE